MRHKPKSQNQRLVALQCEFAENAEDQIQTPSFIYLFIYFYLFIGGGAKEREEREKREMKERYIERMR